MDFQVSDEYGPAAQRNGARLTVLGLVVLVVIFQLLFHRDELKSPATAVVWSFLLLLVGVSWKVALENVLRIIGHTRKGQACSWREILASRLFLAATTAALATWPNGCVLDFPMESPSNDGGRFYQFLIDRSMLFNIVPLFLLLLAIIAMPATLLSMKGYQEIAFRYVDLVAWGGLGIGFVVVLLHTIACRDHYGNNPDFYYYICYARDTVATGKAHLSQYVYFPGVYVFWEHVIRLTGGSLQSLQLALLLVVLANSVLIGVVVWRVLRVALAAFLAAFLYLGVVELFEGYGGTAEPLATLTFLASLAVWAGEPFRGFNGALRAVIVGVFLGLTVFFKQQAGMLTLGFVVLPMEHHFRRSPPRHQLSLLTLVPIVAVGTLLIAVLTRGEGLVPLMMGLDLAKSGLPIPGIHNTSIPGALVRFLRFSNAADLLVCGTVVSQMWIRLSRNTRASVDQTAADVQNVVLLSFLATLTQFRWKPFRHYGLLSLPCLVIVFVLSVVELYRYLGRKQPFSPMEKCLWGSLVALPLLVACQTSLPERVNSHCLKLPELWHLSPEGQDVIKAFRPFVTPGEDTLVIPRGLNALHYALGTVAVSDPEGYRYLNPREEILRIFDLSAGPKVVLYYSGETKNLEPPEDLIWIVDILRSSGLRPNVITDECTVWRPEE